MPAKFHSRHGARSVGARVRPGGLAVLMWRSPALLDRLPGARTPGSSPLLNEISRAIEVGAEADGLPTIGFRPDVGPRSRLVDKCPDPAGIMAAIGEHHRPRCKPAQETRRSSTRDTPLGLVESIARMMLHSRSESSQ